MLNNKIYGRAYQVKSILKLIKQRVLGNFQDYLGLSKQQSEVMDGSAKNSEQNQSMERVKPHN